MQKEFGDKIIPEAIGTICFEFYYIKTDRFEINKDTIYRYDGSKFDYDNDHIRIRGEEQVRRELIDEYKWKIQTSQSFVGRFGIIDDTKNVSDKMQDGKWFSQNKDIICIGSKMDDWCGGIYGVINGGDLKGFGEQGDTITIHVDFVKNMVTFTSEMTEKVTTKNLRSGHDVVRFVAEFYYHEVGVESWVQILE